MIELKNNVYTPKRILFGPTSLLLLIYVTDSETAQTHTSTSREHRQQVWWKWRTNHRKIAYTHYLYVVSKTEIILPTKLVYTLNVDQSLIEEQPYKFTIKLFINQYPTLNNSVQTFSILIKIKINDNI